MKFYAHRFVLAKSSSVFKTMLYEKHWPESVGEEVTVKETPECQAVFDLFIKYLYTAEVSVNVETAVDILLLADKYDVATLKDLFLYYMVKKSNVVQMETALAWYSCAKSLKFSTLEEACFGAITLSTQSMIKSTKSISVDLESDVLEEILSSSKLAIDEEYDLFVGLSQWLLEEIHVPNLKENSERLLPLIRFPQINDIGLRQIELSQLAAHEECSQILQELLGRAFRFITLSGLPQDLLDFSDIFYMPRDYLTRKVYECEMKAEGGKLLLSDGCQRGIFETPQWNNPNNAFGRTFSSNATTGFVGGYNFGAAVPTQTTQGLFQHVQPLCVINTKNVKAAFGPGVSGGESGLWDISLTYSKECVLRLCLCAKNLLGKEVPIQASLLVTDMKNRVIKSKSTSIRMCQTGSQLNVDMALPRPVERYHLIVLIKPMPCKKVTGCVKAPKCLEK